MAVHVETDRPTRKTVLLVEDAPAWKSILFDYLHDAGHRVHIADTVPKLTGIIYERMPELGIDVVVADNRLEDQKELETHLLGEHGASTDVTPLLAWIKNTYPHIYIIGMSGWGEVRGADMQLSKDGRDDVDRLGDIVSDLPKYPDGIIYRSR